MIAQLRRRHRWMTGAMGFVAFAGLMIGIAHRPPSAVMNTLPDALTQQMAVPKAAPNASGDNLWQGVKLKTTVYPRQVELSVLEPLYRPDPLLYWSEHIAESGAALPPGAILLGAVAGRGGPQRFRLPSADGALLLFSLAHGEVFASLALTPEES